MSGTLAIIAVRPVLNQKGIALTKADYERLYREARKAAANLDAASRARLIAVYKKAAAQAAEVVKRSLDRGLSELTIDRWDSISKQLAAAADSIAHATELAGKSNATKVGPLVTKINSDYLYSAAVAAGADGIITKALVGRMVDAINQRVAQSLSTRLWSDGYTFSSRVWNGVRAGWLDDMKMTIAAGIAQGRDPVKIAKDIQVFTADGKLALIQRWGNLERGTSAFIKRIPGKVDWRATRLVRSELYASLQDASAMAGQANPGSTGEYDWVLSAGRVHWGCECEELAAGSPYTYEELPTYPHPNCHPAGTLVLTAKGEIPIENVLPGDIVISHDGSLQRVINSWRSYYENWLLKFETKEGAVEATPDHNFLSMGDWILAHAINNRHSITRVSFDVKSIPLIEDISDNLPPQRFKECGLFRVLSFLNICGGVPMTAIDFDGQLYVLNSDIDPIPANCKAGERLFSKTDQGIIHHAFVGRPELSGVELRYAGLMFIRIGTTPPSLVCGSNICLLSTGIAPYMSIVNGWKCESQREKVPVNALSGYPKVFSYLVDREVIIPEQLDQNILIKINTCTHNSAIVYVSKRLYKGTVYNLSVENTHSFIANGFASHNCMCTVRPHLRNRADFVNDLRRWSDGENVDYLDAWDTTWLKSN